MGSPLRASCTYPSMDSVAFPNFVISTGASRILLLNRPIASNVLKAMRFSEAPMSTNALMI